MDLTELEAAGGGPCVVVMQDGHVRGPFKTPAAASKWADKQEAGSVSHAKPLIGPDADYTPE